MSKLDKIDQCEDVVCVLARLAEMTASDPKWGEFVQEMLHDYRQHLEELKEDYWNSAEYKEFTPEYTDKDIREHVMFLRAGGAMA